MTVINNFQTWQTLMRTVNVQQNGQIPPAVFDAWYNDINEWLLKHLVEVYALNQTISDLLSPFIVPVNVIVTQQPGQNWGLVRYPSDYQYFLNATILRHKDEEKCFINEDYPIIDAGGKSRKYTDPDYSGMIRSFAGANIEERQVNLIDTQRWASCLNHYTKGPTWKDPKMTQFKDGFKIAPKGLTSVLLYYIRTPQKSLMAYTISSDDIAIYDGAGSTQLEWSDQAAPIFLAKLVSKYGLYVDKTEYVQLGEQLLQRALKD